MITKFESNEISTSFESHPHKENANTYDYSNTKPTKWLRYFTLLFILYLPFLLLLVWEGVTYYYIKRSLHEVNEKIHKHRKDLQGWKYRIYQEDVQIETQRARNWSQIGINLIGSGRGIIQTTVKDKALYSWNVSYSIGDISFKWRYVKIHVPGIYQITAQIFFADNREGLGTSEAGFYLAKNRKDPLAVVSVPLSSCKQICTQQVTHMANLSRDDMLYVATFNDNLKLRMSPDKTFWSVHLLKSLP